MAKRGFTELLPVMLSEETDPLCHSVFDATIPYYETKYQLTKSMILHKQQAVSYLDKIFIFSPNIRLETADKKDTGRHLIEFTQLDLEVKDATRDDVIALGESLFVHLLKEVKEKRSEELKLLGKEIKIPKIPFPRVKYAEAVEKYGADFELALSKESESPVWLIDIPITKREFYDKEVPPGCGYLADMDLIYPEGYCEALSGGEREFDYERILQRIKQSGQEPATFAKHLQLAKEGKLAPSAGFGIGIERLTRYICGLERVEMARAFAKLPG